MLEESPRACFFFMLIKKPKKILQESSRALSDWFLIKFWLAIKENDPGEPKAVIYGFIIEFEIQN